MKRKRIEIMTIVFIILCTVVLYVIQNNKIAWFNKNSKDENTSTNVLKTENVANARDGIKGVTQPYPFITNPSGVENNLLQNANGSLIGQLIYLQRENLPEAEHNMYLVILPVKKQRRLNKENQLKLLGSFLTISNGINVGLMIN